MKAVKKWIRRWICIGLAVVMALSVYTAPAAAEEMAAPEETEEESQPSGQANVIPAGEQEAPAEEAAPPDLMEQPAAEEAEQEEPAPEMPGDEADPPAAGTQASPENTFTPPPEPDPNMQVEGPAELIPIRYLFPDAVSVNDVMTETSFSGLDISLDGTAYGYYLGNNLYFIISANAYNNYGNILPEEYAYANRYEEGEVWKLMEASMQTGIVSPRMLCANPEEITNPSGQLYERASYIVSWYYDGSETNGEYVDGTGYTSPGPGNDIFYSDTEIKRVFKLRQDMELIGASIFEYGYDVSWEAHYEQYKLVFGTEPPLPPGWRYGTDEELINAWLDANSVMYQVQDLETESVERLRLESLLKLYHIEEKPELWSQEKWEAFQAAMENARRVNAKANATAEEMSIAREAAEIAYQDAVNEATSEQIRNGRLEADEKKRQEFQDILNAYRNKLSDPRSDEFKAVADKFGVSGRKVDMTATGTEIVVILNETNKTQPGTEENAQGIIDFAGKVVQILGEGAAAVLEKYFGDVPFLGDAIDAEMDRKIDSATKGVTTTLTGIHNRANLPSRVNERLNQTPGNIDGVNDMLVPEDRRGNTGGSGQ